MYLNSQYCNSTTSCRFIVSLWYRKCFHTFESHDLSVKKWGQHAPIVEPNCIYKDPTLWWQSEPFGSPSENSFLCPYNMVGWLYCEENKISHKEVFYHKNNFYLLAQSSKFSNNAKFITLEICKICGNWRFCKGLSVRQCFNDVKGTVCLWLVDVMWANFIHLTSFDIIIKLFHFLQLVLELYVMWCVQCHWVQKEWNFDKIFGDIYQILLLTLISMYDNFQSMIVIKDLNITMK